MVNYLWEEFFKKFTIPIYEKNVSNARTIGGTMMRSTGIFLLLKSPAISPPVHGNRLVAGMLEPLQE